MGAFQTKVYVAWAATMPWVTALCLGILLDVLCGLMVAFAGKKLSSSTSRTGIARKLIMLAVVAFFAIIDGFLPPFPVPVLGPVTWAGLASFYMLVTEGISLLEKAALLNVPIPHRLLAALEKLRDELDSTPPGEVTAVAVAVATSCPADGRKEE